MAARLSALRSGRPPFTPGRFLVLISVRGRVDPRVIVAAGRIRPTEKPNDLIGNATRDLPACSVVPQPTTLPTWYVNNIKKTLGHKCDTQRCAIYYNLGRPCGCETWFPAVVFEYRADAIGECFDTRGGTQRNAEKVCIMRELHNSLIKFVSKNHWEI
jgi:hypothetical protein